MDEALAVEDVRKTYGGRDGTVALDGVSLSVAEGEVFGLVGPNGAGKTTLVRALTGTTPVEGTVRVFGEAPTAVDPARIGLLPQSFSPPERLTARELVRYYAGLYDRARDPEAVLSDVGLGGAANTWYENLSGGQRRRACVATALVNEPDALFLDEPTTGIDPGGRRSLWRLIEELADAGTTVFLTSHAMDEVERLSDRVGLLADGTLAVVGSPADLVAEHGGKSRLVVRTAAGTDAVREARYPVEATTDALIFHGVAPAAIGEVVGTLERCGVEYGSLTWEEPSLEGVYLRLTGERYPAARSGAGGARTGPEAEAGPGSGADAESGSEADPIPETGGDSGTRTGSETETGSGTDAATSAEGGE